jgi:predicted kinase
MSADDWMVALDVDLWDGGRRSRIEALQWDLTQRLLTLGQVVLIEWGSWARAERDALRSRARELGAAVELRYLTAGLDVLFERVQARGMEVAFGSRATTLDDMRAYASALEPPDDDELALYDPALGE